MAPSVIDWDTLVEERNAWVAHNFPDPDGSRTPLDSVLGVIEELGELAHHHLKQAQSIRGDDDHHEAEAKDAIGDLTVYLLGVMSYYEVRPSHHALLVDPAKGRSSDQVMLWLGWWVGRAALNQVRVDRFAEAKFVVSRIISVSEYYCQARGWDYAQIVQDTWDHVKQRDWIKYPDTGLPPEGIPYA